MDTTRLNHLNPLAGFAFALVVAGLALWAEPVGVAVLVAATALAWWALDDVRVLGRGLWRRKILICLMFFVFWAIGGWSLPPAEAALWALTQLGRLAAILGHAVFLWRRSSRAAWVVTLARLPGVSTVFAVLGLAVKWAPKVAADIKDGLTEGGLVRKTRRLAWNIAWDDHDENARRVESAVLGSDDAGSWRAFGVGLLWVVVLGVGVFLLRETGW
jgi:hypothetical protein